MSNDQASLEIDLWPLVFAQCRTGSHTVGTVSWYPTTAPCSLMATARCGTSPSRSCSTPSVQIHPPQPTIVPCTFMSIGYQLLQRQWMVCVTPPSQKNGTSKLFAAIWPGSLTSHACQPSGRPLDVSPDRPRSSL